MILAVDSSYNLDLLYILLFLYGILRIFLLLLDSFSTSLMLKRLHIKMQRKEILNYIPFYRYTIISDVLRDCGSQSQTANSFIHLLFCAILPILKVVQILYLVFKIRSLPSLVAIMGAEPEINQVAGVVLIALIAFGMSLVYLIISKIFIIYLRVKLVGNLAIDIKRWLRYTAMISYGLLWLISGLFGTIASYLILLSLKLSDRREKK